MALRLEDSAPRPPAPKAVSPANQREAGYRSRRGAIEARLAASPIQSVADFRGKRIAIGAKGSGMEQHVHMIFDVLGIPFDSFTPVHMSFADGAAALINGKIDVQFHPPIPNKVLTDLSQKADIRVIPFAPGQLDKDNPVPATCSIQPASAPGLPA